MVRKILLVGNHTCANRGDSAILRGLLAFMEANFVGAEVDVTSRYPVSSAYLLGREVLPDDCHRYYGSLRGGRGGVLSKVARRLVPLGLSYHVQKRWWRWLFPVPKFHRDLVERYERYDFVVQVGGSFFVDLYGAAQFDSSLCAMLAGRKVYALGHSVGPFSGVIFNQVARTTFSKMECLALRERESVKHLDSLGAGDARVTFTGDTAWLVPVNDVGTLKVDAVAFTFRELAPFDVRLGVTQEAYELACARSISRLLDRGFKVLGVSTCTPLENYSKDDRIVALRIRQLLGGHPGFTVIMDELDDRRLGELLASCRLTVGTRLHSAIISMNSGTPAIAINYEHKSVGVMRQLGLPELSVSVDDLVCGQIDSLIDELLSDESLSRRVKAAVVKERSFVAGTIEDALSAAFS